ncbi:MAG TPA: contractile injection system tape measure protein [Saprospiraceae bacterium]|nr:contractile injection system tape measure protein [Saprospiraceae bacterium]
MGIHVVQQQYLDISFNGQEDVAITLQERFISSCSRHLIPVLDSILEQYAPAHGHLQIDRLEIDLGIINLHDLESSLPIIFRESMESTLREITANKYDVRTISTPDFSNENLRYVDDPAYAVEAYIYFLKNGRLPWNFRIPQDKSLNQIIHSIIHASGDDRVFQLILHALQNENARKRISESTFDDITGDLFFKKLSPESLAEIKTLKSLFSASEYILLRQKFTVAGLELLSAGYFAPSASQLFGTALRLLGSDQNNQAKSTIQYLFKNSKTLPAQFSLLLKNNAYVSNDAIASPDSAGNPEPYKEEKEEAIYIDNAGLILLHPFLQMLFEGTGIAKDEILIQPERALYLLHFLVTGSLQPQEYELTFAKILCGIPIELPVSSQVTLAPEEIEEANAVLDAVIRHWSILQNTSHEGLRNTFLQRPGKISFLSDNEWLLQVETQSFDILLNHIPWGFSMVKLPWMTHMLRVEWQTP